VARYLADDCFPNYVLANGQQNTLILLLQMFERYSECGLTVPSDRPIAISGLENRIGRALKCKWQYGIFKSFMHRLLLWQRRDEAMQRILFKHAGVPSWSWMAYTGRIVFLEIPFGKVKWNKAIRYPFQTAESDAFEGPAKKLRIQTADDEWGGLVFDNDIGSWDVQSLRCFVVGRRARPVLGDVLDLAHYLLILAPLKRIPPGAYQRVGVGVVKGRSISSESEWVRVF